MSRLNFMMPHQRLSPQRKIVALLLNALALCAASAQGQNAPNPHPPWHLKDGTPIDEEWVISFLSQHEQAVENYEGGLSDYWQPFVGAALREADISKIEHEVNPRWVEGGGRAGLRRLDFSDCDLTSAKFDQLQLSHIDFGRADLSEASFIGSELDQCVLTHATLGDTVFRGAFLHNSDAHATHFSGVDLKGAILREVNLQSAGFSGAAKLEGARFQSCDITGGGFNEASLTNAIFDDTILACSAFVSADLTGATWEPTDVPNVSNMLRVTGLDTLRYVTSGARLVQLRKAFEDAGLRYSEREVNCALQTQRMNHLWNRGAEEGLMEDDDSSTFSDKAEVAFRKVLFDWPVRYGLYPGRALKLIAFLCGLCAIPYAAVMFQRPRRIQDHRIRRANAPPDLSQSGIWAVPLEKQIAATPAGPVLVYVNWRREGWLRALWRAASMGLFFSVISAFNTGYKDLDVGRWIERIKHEESTLRGTGWVRTLSGLQSLVSFYLLALWVLTYFGRPFE